jgi:tetratricopeptide (TPR) repeat protein
MKYWIFIPLLLFVAPSGGASDSAEKTLYQDSIQSTKQSIARETLDAIYHDALDYYRDHRYPEALQLLDKIYSIDPKYEDVSRLRNSIIRSNASAQESSTRDQVRKLMRQGETALASGQTVAAINSWKTALELDPHYTQAQKRIDEVNHSLAQKQFEAGYLHKNRGQLEEALDAWSNAIALDPSYKERGLLLLMSKIQRQVRAEQTTRLATQGYDQYQKEDYDAARDTYEEILRLEPRNEEARRMSTKIKIHLAQTYLKAAEEALSKKAWPEAVEFADKVLSTGYQTGRAQQIKDEATRQIQLAKNPPPVKKPVKKPVVVQSTATVPPPPTSPADAEESLRHYRQGMAAIRKKDYHLAMDELDTAAKLDPSNERIYMARERARQEWNAANAAPANP